MPATITVTQQSERAFRVVVEEGSTQTTHLVSAEPAYCEALTGGAESAGELVRRSFEFLLEREPKEAILRTFDLPVIGRYFPEYERVIKKRLQG
jgi:hypothetical protein